METTIVYWGDIGIMEKKMETTIQDLVFRVYLARFSWKMCKVYSCFLHRRKVV